MTRVAHSLVLVIVILTTTALASANGVFVLGPVGEETSLAEQRVAVSDTGDVRTFWWSMRAPEDANRLAVVLVVPDPAQVDLGAGLLDALDLATAPRILEPAACVGESDRHLENTARPWGKMRRDPASMVSLADTGELETWAQSLGFELAAADAQSLDVLVGAGALLALQFENLSRRATAEVRWSVAFEAPTDPFDLVIPDVPVTLFSVASQRSRIANGAEVRADALGTLWPKGGLVSDYLERREGLSSDLTGQWIVEAAAPPLRRAMPSVGFIPSLEDAYDDAGDDLNIAFGGRPLAETWVTRLVGALERRGVALEPGDEESFPPIVRAADEVGCGAPAAPPVAPAPRPPIVESRPDESVVESGGEGCYECSQIAVDILVDGSCSGDSSGGDGCTGDTSASGDDACSGDSSGSSDACSGDSAGSSSGDACSGDSSGSSDACSGDSAGSSSEACSGDTSSSSSCSGSSSSSCAVGRLRGVRKVSTVTYLLAGLAFGLRRSRRRERVSPADVAKTTGTAPKTGFWSLAWLRARTRGFRLRGGAPESSGRA